MPTVLRLASPPPKRAERRTTAAALLTRSPWLRARIEQGRRDVEMLLDGIRGVRQPPFTERPHRERASAPKPEIGARELTITRIERQTPDAVTLHLTDPTGARLPFAAGQFLTVITTLGGREVRRAYSLCTDPGDPTRVAITVKRVSRGLVSNHLNDNARAGDVLRVLGPSGAFVVSPSAADHLVLIAGGSGITPILSILESELRASHRKLYLVFGNRSLSDIIFRRALEDLAARHPERLTIVHALSDPPFDWSGEVGLLEAPVLERCIDRLGLPPGATFDAFVCGPAPMMDSTRQVLTGRGVASERIHEERFLSPHLRAPLGGDALEPDGVTRLRPPIVTTIRVSGIVRDVTVGPDQSLLEAAIASGVKVPYSCTMGGCGACRVRVERGRIEMEEPNCLTPEKRSAGFVLSCVGRPVEPSLVEVPARIEGA
jgi:ring-1,2-phenylacetyl-CoA epoxidase subunit PaaE